MSLQGRHVALRCTELVLRRKVAVSEPHMVLGVCGDIQVQDQWPKRKGLGSKGVEVMAEICEFGGCGTRAACVASDGDSRLVKHGAWSSGKREHGEGVMAGEAAA